MVLKLLGGRKWKEKGARRSVVSSSGHLFHSRVGFARARARAQKTTQTSSSSREIISNYFSVRRGEEARKGRLGRSGIKIIPSARAG